MKCFQSHIKLASICVLAIYLSQCSSSSSSRSSNEMESSNIDEPSKPSKSAAFSKKKSTFAWSISNNKENIVVADQSEVQSIIRQLKSKTQKARNGDQSNLEALIAAQTIGKRPLKEILVNSKKLVDIEMSTNINKNLPEFTELSMAVSAWNNKKIGLARFYISKLSNSKRQKIRAGIKNLNGLIYLNQNKIPEAMAAWYSAIKEDSNYTPSILNIGLLSLYYGDFVTARKFLEKRSNTLISQKAMISLERLSGNTKKAEKLCSRLLDELSNDKAIALNCGLNNFEGLNNVSKARTLLSRASASSNRKIKTKATETLNKIRQQEAMKAQKNSKMKKK